MTEPSETLQATLDRLLRASKAAPSGEDEDPTIEDQDSPEGEDLFMLAINDEIANFNRVANNQRTKATGLEPKNPVMAQEFFAASSNTERAVGVMEDVEERRKLANHALRQTALGLLQAYQSVRSKSKPPREAYERTLDLLERMAWLVNMSRDAHEIPLKFEGNPSSYTIEEVSSTAELHPTVVEKIGNKSVANTMAG